LQINIARDYIENVKKRKRYSLTYQYWLAAFKKEIKKRPRGFQKELAKRLHKTAVHINDILGQRKGASLELQEKIAQDLGYSYKEMIEIGKQILEEANFQPICYETIYLKTEKRPKEKIGQRLKQARLALNLTQKQFAERLGLKWHQIKDMESGKLLIKPEIAEQIEKIFSINFRWLLIGENEMFLKPEIREPKALYKTLKNDRDIVTEKIITMLQDMSDEQKREILRYIEEKKLLTDLLKERRK